MKNRWISEKDLIEFLDHTIVENPIFGNIWYGREKEYKIIRKTFLKAKAVEIIPDVRCGVCLEPVSHKGHRIDEFGNHNIFLDWDCGRG